MIESAKDLFIGAQIYHFNMNRRIYAKNDRGFSSGAPIYREHWYLLEIKGETSRSWILSNGYKLPKNYVIDVHSLYLFDERQLNEKCWVKENWINIKRAVGEIKDYKLLKAIANLIDYQE